MLNKLFGSNSRVKIIKLFIYNPDEKFYIRQIARNLSLQLNSVRRELENLESFGLLVSSKAEQLTEEGDSVSNILSLLASQRKISKKNVDSLTSKNPLKGVSSKNKRDKKYYCINKDFILYEEIQSLFIRAQILYERDFVEKIKELGSVKLLVLTGFFVNNINSSTDILIVGKLNRKKLHAHIKGLENELSREINYTYLDTKEYKYRRDLTDVFLYNIFDGPKIVVINEVGLN